MMVELYMYRYPNKCPFYVPSASSFAASALFKGQTYDSGLILTIHAG